MRQRRFDRLTLAVLLCGVTLSGCSWVKEWPPRDEPARHNAAAAPTVPQAKLMQTADATWLVPAGKNPETVEHMVPATGEQISTINRVRELEQELAQLRNEMSMMLPAMTRLAETQTAMREALAVAVTPAAGHPVATAPVDDMQAGQPLPLYRDPAASGAAQPVSTPATIGTVTHIRFGEHNGKTRIVLDAAQAPAFETVVDNNESLLVVRLPRFGWNAAASQAVQDSPLISAYSATPDGAGGTTLALQLRRPAAVAMAQALPPGAGRGHRVVIDLAPL